MIGRVFATESQSMVREQAGCLDRNVLKSEVCNDVYCGRAYLRLGAPRPDRLQVRVAPDADRDDRLGFGPECPVWTTGPSGARRPRGPGGWSPAQPRPDGELAVVAAARTAGEVGRRRLVRWPLRASRLAMARLSAGSSPVNPPSAPTTAARWASSSCRVLPLLSAAPDSGQSWATCWSRSSAPSWASSGDHQVCGPLVEETTPVGESPAKPSLVRRSATPSSSSTLEPGNDPRDDEAFR